MGIAVARAKRSYNVGHLVASDLMASPAAVVRETQTVYEAAALMLRSLWASARRPSRDLVA
jgi:hypothetical protein